MEQSFAFAARHTLKLSEAIAMPVGSNGARERLGQAQGAEYAKSSKIRVV
jgi:hypothetical protein